MEHTRDKNAFSAFTLIELLVVIAIIAILAVVVVLTLNPAQLLAQSRDANRVSDMATLQSAISLYQTDLGGTATLGTSTVVYVSLPDNTSSACGTLGLPALPAGYIYDCSTSTSTRLINNQGWVPLDFTKISSGVPFGSLPIDPVNSSSSGLYYTYTTNGNQYQLISIMESQKYKQNIVGPLGNGVDVAGSMQGIGPVGWWPLNEATTGTTVYDKSGNGNNGTWTGIAAGANGTYYVSGRSGGATGYFNGSNDCVTIPTSTTLSATNFTASFWMQSASTTFLNYGGLQERTAGGIVFMFTPNGAGNTFGLWTSYAAYVGVSSPGQWNLYTATLNGSIVSIFINGVFAVTSGGASIGQPVGSIPTNIGCDPAFGRYFPGLINDARIYNRALSAVEIQALYNAGK